MTHLLTKILILLLAVVLLLAPAVAEEVGKTDVSATFSEIVLSADLPVSLTGYTVNGKTLDRITVLPNDVVVISVNAIPPGMVLKTIVTINGEDKELTGNPVTLSGFPKDNPTSIAVYLSFAFPQNDAPQSSGGAQSQWATPTYSPTEQPIPPHPSGNQTEQPSPAESGSSSYIIHCICPLCILIIGLVILVLFLRRKIYRILKKRAKEYGFETERKHLKEIATALIALIRNKTRYPNWRRDKQVYEYLRADIIKTLNTMGYPAVPRKEISAEILKAGKGLLTRYLL